jgi:hypothetical protein
MHQGKARYLLDNRLVRCRFHFVEFILFVCLTLDRPLAYPLGSLGHRVDQCLRHFQPPGHFVEGFEFEHRELGKILSQVPFLFDLYRSHQGNL